MLRAYFMPTKSLTAQLVGKEPCGPTHHKECLTNFDWCNAECTEQNTKHGREVFVVCCDEKGTVWVAIKDKLPTNWVSNGVHNE